MSGPPLAAASGIAVENDLEKVTIAPSEGAASLAQDNNTAADYYNLSYSHCECTAIALQTLRVATQAVIAVSIRFAC